MTDNNHGILPLDPFEGERFADALVEAKGEVGLATDLVAQVEATAEHWRSYVDDAGKLELSAYSGELVAIRLAEVREQKPSTRTAAGSALRGLVRRLLGKPTMDSYLYDIEIVDNDGQARTSLTAKVLTGGKGSTQVSGKRTVETADGPKTTDLRVNSGLKAAVKQATVFIEDSFPLRAEAAIAEKQAKPCEVIIGNEAAAVQDVVEACVGSADMVTLNEGVQMASYKIVEPGFDGQWSVTGFDAVLQPDTVSSNTPEAADNFVMTSSINFSGEEVNNVDGLPLIDPLLVLVRSVYEKGSNRLLAAEVKYFTHSVGGTQNALPVSPESRQEIHAAIASQLVPENLISVLPQPKK